MTDMIAVAYRDEATAKQVLTELRSLNTEHSLHLADALLVVRDEEGKVTIDSGTDAVVSGAAEGALWGGLIGLLLLQPLLGAAIGAAAGGITAAVSKDDDDETSFITQLGHRLEPGSAAVIALVIAATEDKVLPRIAHFGGDVLHTLLSAADELRLRTTLSPQPATVREPSV